MESNVISLSKYGKFSGYIKLYERGEEIKQNILQFLLVTVGINVGLKPVVQNYANRGT